MTEKLEDGRPLTIEFGATITRSEAEDFLKELREEVEKRGSSLRVLSVTPKMPLDIDPDPDDSTDP